MPACSINDHQSMGSWSDLAGNLLQVQGHSVGIAHRHNQDGSKGNQRSLHSEVALHFNQPQNKELSCYETTDADHGRIEIRRAWVSHEVDWLHCDRADPSTPRFPGLSCIAMVQAQVEHKGQTSCSRRFYLSSAQLTAKQFLHATRAHWGIENRLHWVMDVVFHDDLMRLRTQSGPANMPSYDTPP